MNVGSVAQLGERLLCTQGVAGSSPVQSTSSLSLAKVLWLGQSRALSVALLQSILRLTIRITPSH